MNVELTTDTTAADLDLLHTLYNDSFPAEERRPWEQIVRPDTPSCPLLFTIIADGHIAGMLTLWTFDRFAYIEHLAIIPAFRAKGVGSDAVKLMLEKLGQKPVVVEIEPPVTSDPASVKRQKFYSRLGFVTIDAAYIQPPYGPGLPSVSMYLLATTTLPAASTAATLRREVYNQ